MQKLNYWSNNNSTLHIIHTFQFSPSLWSPVTVPLSVCSLSLGSSVDPDPTAAVVDPASPSSDPCCSRAFSQPAEQHQWGQYLCFCSHTHYSAAPVTTHPDCSCKTWLPTCQHWCSWSWLLYLDTSILCCFFFVCVCGVGVYKIKTAFINVLLFDLNRWKYTVCIIKEECLRVLH